MPLISLVTGGIHFENWFVSLDGKSYATLQAAQDAGASTLNFGKFISAVIYFIIMAFCVFLIVKMFNRLEERVTPQKEEAPATTKICPYCKSEIPIGATRCPNCTSELPKE